MKVGPPLTRVVLMYCDNGVMRVLRSAGGALEFGPASLGCSSAPLRFTLRRSLDPNFVDGSPIWPVIWRRYDDGRMFSHVGHAPIQWSAGQPRDGHELFISIDVQLDKRAWLVTS